MAGSIVWRPYGASIPAGVSFSIQCDESNARGTYNNVAIMPAGVLPQTQKPKTLRLRKLRCSLVTNARIIREFYVADPVVFNTIASDTAAVIKAPVVSDPTDATGGVAADWNVNFAVQEKYTRRPRVADSGLTDGTPAN